MVSIETLEMEIKHLNQQLEEVKEWQKEILDTLNKLDDRYPTRREVKVIIWVMWFVSTLLWIIAVVLWFTK